MKIAHGTLVMVLDGEKMLLLRNQGDEKYAVLETLMREDIDNPPSREQGTDAPGRTFSSTTQRRSSYGETDWHRQAEERFALAALEQLDRAARRSDEDIVVVAPPRTLGDLRDHWPHRLRDRLVAEIGKDLVHHATDDIVRAIAGHEAQHAPI